MFGAFCKGIHCAGCGKGIPAFVVLLLAGIYTATLTTALLIEVVAICTAVIIGVIIITASLLGWLVNKGPRCIFMRTDRITYSEMKFLETGNRDWLAISGGAYSDEMVRYHSLAIPYRGTHERQGIQRFNVDTRSKQALPYKTDGLYMVATESATLKSSVATFVSVAHSAVGGWVRMVSVFHGADTWRDVTRRYLLRLEAGKAGSLYAGSRSRFGCICYPTMDTPSENTTVHQYATQTQTHTGRSYAW
jgi:hypothetical protein